MVYILNTEVPDRKATKIALQKIFGIGKEKSQEICKHLGISETTPVKLLSTELKNNIERIKNIIVKARCNMIINDRKILDK